MSTPSTRPYRFGDLLALARQSWVRQMATGLAAAGYRDYRRSDAVLVRMLQGGPLSIGRLGDPLGVTRQAARKLVTGLERRGYATAVRDGTDARQLNVVLTMKGHAYADALVTVIDRLNHDLLELIDPAQLAAADAVLRALLSDEHARALAEKLTKPTARGPDHP